MDVPAQRPDQLHREPAHVRSLLTASLRKYWNLHGEADALAKPIGAWLTFDPLIVRVLFFDSTGQRSGLMRLLRPDESLDFQAYKLIWDLIEPRGTAELREQGGILWSGDLDAGILEIPVRQHRLAIWPGQ